MDLVAAVILGGRVAPVIARPLLCRGASIRTVFRAGAFLMGSPGTLPLVDASEAIETNLSSG